MLSLVDRDVFSTVTGLGRAAADSVALAVAGAPFDESTTTRVIDRWVARSGGISLLPAMLYELRSLGDSPLWAPALVPHALDRIERLRVGAERSAIDLLAVREAQASILAGDYRALPFLQSLGRTCIDRVVLTSRGGFVDRYGGGAKLEQAREMVEPVAQKFAAVLHARPNAVRLGLTPDDDVTADTDLLGGRR